MLSLGFRDIKNKEKELASGNEVIQTEDATPLQTHLNIPKTLKLVPASFSKKRKVVSRMVDMGNLPSRWGLKRAKVDLSNRGKAPLIKSNPPQAENLLKSLLLLKHPHLKLSLVLIRSHPRPLLCLPLTLL